jgi:perosamine synthetase
MPDRSLNHSAQTRPMPRSPVFGWACFGRSSKHHQTGVESLPERAFTTSGRAAIFHALEQLQLAPDSVVLVPTYHCPTMIAPILLARARPAYFGITADGLPNLDSIAPELAGRACAMLVPHYFGLPKSLANVRHWCDSYKIALIEDCAHSLFGVAGERDVGAWGDYACASLSKFLPVPEAGILASAHHALTPLKLSAPPLTSQVKGIVDVLELGARHRRLLGLNNLIATVLALKNMFRRKSDSPSSPALAKASDFILESDMQRIGRRPVQVSTWLFNILPRGRIIERRRKNYAIYRDELQDLTGAYALMPEMPDDAAPYVFPLWVDDADKVYHTLRSQGYPIFRWDRIWPGTPTIESDVGPAWSTHVLQLLCHQDLAAADIRQITSATRKLLASSATPE